MKIFLIRGVPIAMQRDGWWLNAPPVKKEGPANRETPTPSGWAPMLLVPLIALGDILIWHVVPGLSLAVFGAVLVMAALWMANGRVSAQRQAIVAGGSVLALLPLVELVQPLSFLIAIVGVTAMLAFLAGLRLAELARGALRLWPLGVRQTFVDAGKAVQPKGKRDLNDIVSKLMLLWAMPIALGLLFALLLLEANPIASRWAQGLWSVDLALPDGSRTAFWICLIPLSWTVLSLSRMRERLRATKTRAVHMGPAREGLINPASMVRALVLFNAVFALQTLMDIAYLYGGVGLPEGITYAEYAHRGAYPLVITALLAGGFALLTQRWVRGNRLLRALLMIWVAQNVALVVSSLVRLELYVEVYGLTHLRLAAAIWMGLVTGGLMLILWQVWKGRNNGWLVLRGGAMAAVVLYACSWVSFDATIADYNLTNDPQPDAQYLCNLGDAAKPVIAAHNQHALVPICRFAQHSIDVPQDWREWGFRNWRARTSLAAIQAEARSQVNP
jgi:hypothetical protein